MRRRDSPTAKLFVRLDPGVGLESRKERAVSRLESLAGREAIADFDVLAWARGIRPDGPLSDVQHCRTLLEHVGDLREWIDDNDVDCCGFEARDVTSTVTDESYGVISLPAICLSVYQSDDLVDVYPRRMDGTFESVADGLASLGTRSPRLSGQPRGD